MRRDVVTISQEMSLRAAAHLLFQSDVTGGPVVDADGRCVGVLSATDFLHWADEGGHGLDDVPLTACPYQLKGRLLNGEEAVICKLAEGNCTTAGRHTAVCRQPNGAVNGSHLLPKNLPLSGLRRYMTRDVVTVRPETPLSELARTMIDAHIYRVIVVDEERKPVGIVSSTDLLATLAYNGGQARPGVAEPERKERLVMNPSRSPRGVSYGSDTAARGSSNLRHQLIERRAYEKWRGKGSPGGSALQDWLEAEKEVDREFKLGSSPYLCRTRGGALPLVDSIVEAVI
jgi:CBS domain-containing protein